MVAKKETKQVEEKEKTSKKTAPKKVEKKKTTKKVKEKKTPYFKSLKSELSKVKWPSWKEILKYTLATIILCVILGCFFQLLDLLTSVVKGWFN